MSDLTEIFSVLMKGINITITVLIASAILSYLVAFIAGFGRLSNNIFIRKFTGFYVEVFRGTSLIVQLFWFYYALPGLFDIHLASDFWAAVIAIAMNYGAYMSEIVRGSILSVAKGQREAATALNMSRFQRMRLVILPQAVRMMLPEFGNYLIQMLKATSLVSLVGLTDILYHGDIFRSTHLSLAPTVYILILVFYFILALPLIWLTRWAEKQSSKGVASE
ncbi:ectoine/hydroxyectoine ABC transporter permease subunit EhuC [Sediminibacillus halophilus]|uniref:ectoine/hydroxyectoine ABC transporter permease subunit EhuC n=1 Tax=Sediminibacillus halophilus TaxID=482461 RepID=UPI002482078A|nr:ectoine/hydroxyectoine ABC transporter permease subunit EhuC [Sediminibacillus halophilus]